MHKCIIHGVGCLIVYEYSYFCLQEQHNHHDVVAHAVKQYEDSGTQARVFQNLQWVLQEKNNLTVQTLILDIILRNRMSDNFK
ncbi:hypothetical protein SCLCIDRAFT_1222683 [Scleroderma citrinum Foug A]|uniref:Uncharacterized protein n=1 Tax=Scleroderma citrinum Foug A TaxID=1036808 RepID=A0A0C2ZLL1_9AGAM|nr:hypothetical protein SCLCIDRAFT_1224980 [Scleroderma citrinum Foug A]KIM53532.1 hypothetical protein SCLCIDRAFT_1222683 [Scleroderma citrinum Foug A]